MSGRLHEMRVRLHAALVANGTPGDWTHILKQIGMFTFTGLTGTHPTMLLPRRTAKLIQRDRTVRLLDAQRHK